MDILQTPQRLVRVSIITSNIATLISGIGLAAIGISGLSNITFTFLESNVLSWLLISSGIIIILISIFSCAPTLTESRRLILINGVVIILLIISELFFTGYIHVQDNKIDSALDHIWQDSYDHNPRKLKKIERELVCCGFSSLDDRSVPKSSPFACRDSASYGYNIPCQVQLKQAYGKIEYSSFICLVGILVLQLLTLAALVLHWFQVPPEAEIEVQTQEEHNRSLLRDWDREDQDNGHNPAGETPQREGNNDYGSINNLADQ